MPWEEDIFLTPDNPYTGPGVLPAENPDVRNRIIISVVASIVAVSILVTALIAWFRRKRTITAELDDSGIRGVFPPIQPGITDAPPEVGPKLRSKPAVTQKKQQQPELVFPNVALTDSEREAQEQRRISFRRQQESFKQQREAQRRSVSRDYSRSTTYGPTNHEEQMSSPTSSSVVLRVEELAVLDILSENLKKDIHYKQGLFKDLLVRWHPDKHPLEKETATSVFQFLQSKKSWFMGDSLPGTP